MRKLAKGYSDTPIIPGSKWRVHDSDRPEPPVVAPASSSTQEYPGSPPGDALVLFDGSNLDSWSSVRGGDAGWQLVDGVAMEVVPRTGDIRKNNAFGLVIYMWNGARQLRYMQTSGRGNSVFSSLTYEVQVLDNL